MHAARSVALATGIGRVVRYPCHHGPRLIIFRPLSSMNVLGLAFSCHFFFFFVSSLSCLLLLLLLLGARVALIIGGAGARPCLTRCCLIVQLWLARPGLVVHVPPRYLARYKKKESYWSV
ncbi:hypothetical protein IF1G_01414 [Cordyceps javanica]|uniref:Uncharacterized protein n=1 Tax=Cordyceps javanica TaxID=43265 RepID=A0A545VC71_9HYPO|nr:hypothetical protein IF1G_01414 [Cordyceps javanica]